MLPLLNMLLPQHPILSFEYVDVDILQVNDLLMVSKVLLYVANLLNQSPKA